MNNLRKLLLTTALMFIPVRALVWAHPGHGETSGGSLIHYLTEPMHAMVLGAVVLMIAISSTWLLLKMKKRVKERA